MNFETLVEIFSVLPDVKPGNMFGFKSLTVKRKVFALSYEEDLVFKLDEETLSKALALPGAALWNPFGREKKHWVQIPAVHAATWEKYAESACEYVASLV